MVVIARSVRFQTFQEVSGSRFKVFLAFRPVEVSLGLDHNHRLVQRIIHVGVLFIHGEAGLL